ncbi:hypothetical protein FRB94_010769 [Tulasnella sp. JGI-2019a]|nr:hypothetical protein FRB94_010769 [Tulasnella sp. JGI-2019a]
MLSRVTKQMVSKPPPLTRRFAPTSMKLHSDIIIAILDYLRDDITTLYSVLLTCWTLHEITLEVFYCDVSIPKDALKTRRLFTTLAARPDLADFVQTLRWPRDGLMPLKRPVLGIAHIVSAERIMLDSIPKIVLNFQRLRNVWTLELGDIPSPSVLDYTQIIIAFRSMKLTHLYIRRQTPFWQIILPLLRQQSYLTHLRLPRNIWDVSSAIMTAKDMPLLSSVTCDVYTARWLVPGRPISELHLQGVMDLHINTRFDIWEKVVLPAVPITHLSLWVLRQNDLGQDKMLKEAATFLSDISVLKLRAMPSPVSETIHFDHQNVCNLSPRQSPSFSLMPWLCIQMRDDLARFESLRVFHAKDVIIKRLVRPRAIITLGQNVASSQGAWTNPVELWKEVCPGLIEVVINNDRWTWSESRGWTWSDASDCWSDLATIS